MRFLLATGIYPPDAGGPATYTRAIARALSSSGAHQVQVVAYGDEDGVTSEEGFVVERISRHRDVLTRYWNYFLAIVRRAQSSDVLYLQGPASEGLPGTLAALLVGKPTVMKIVGDYAWEMYMNAGGTELLDEFLTHRHAGKIWWLEFIERWTAKRAKHVIVPSAYLKTVVEKWGIASSRITVIHNAVEPLPVARVRDEARAAFGISDQRLILTCARAVPWKAGDFLIDLLSELSSDTVLAIAGDGPSLNTWKEQANTKGIMDRVRFLGRLDQLTLAAWYQAADLFVLPSGYEGFPHAVVEAASAGLGCFVSDKGGNPETQALLGADRVRVLPYRDHHAWREALSGAWPERKATALPPELQMQTMIERTTDVLRSIL